MFNALGAALTAAGSFAPLAALLYGLAGLNVGSHYVVALGIGCLPGGIRPTCDWESISRETSRMSVLEIYVLLSPFLIVAVGLAVVLFARWQDEREDRRRQSSH